MKIRLFQWLVPFICLFLIAGNAIAEESMVSVTPGAKGSKGTICNVIGSDGKPTGTKIIVRGFFADADRMTEVYNFKVTTEGDDRR